MENTKSAGPAPSGSWGEHEDMYWKSKYADEEYYQKDMTYDDYQPAYRFGHESRTRHAGRKWDEIEPDMGSEWEKVKAKSKLQWEHAKHAVKAAWDRVA